MLTQWVTAAEALRHSFRCFSVPEFGLAPARPVARENPFHRRRDLSRLKQPVRPLFHRDRPLGRVPHRQAQEIELSRPISDPT